MRRENELRMTRGERIGLVAWSRTEARDAMRKLRVHIEDQTGSVQNSCR